VVSYYKHLATGLPEIKGLSGFTLAWEEDLFERVREACGNTCYRQSFASVRVKYFCDASKKVDRRQRPPALNGVQISPRYPESFCQLNECYIALTPQPFKKSPKRLLWHPYRRGDHRRDRVHKLLKRNLNFLVEEEECAQKRRSKSGNRGKRFVTHQPVVVELRHPDMGDEEEKVVPEGLKDSVSEGA